MTHVTEEPADAKGRVYQYPKQPSAPVRQPKGAMLRENWPDNVRSIRPPPKPKTVLPPSGFVVLALVEANAKKRGRKGKPPLPACLMDVQAELSAMMDRFKTAGDMEAAAGVYSAMDLLWAGRTGRW